ncbi:MAG: hypothetical protein BRD25_02005 [Bacteroidetes bacterium QH_1_61_8]|nr:MAG: hypothetical protein BRD25_02005 [Bacteroidetes bacterium QH_1_61_8]
MLKEQIFSGSPLELSSVHNPLNPMKRLFQTLAGLITLWVLGGFLGVMLDPARAYFWTQSLMWGLLSSVILAPALIFVEISGLADPKPSTSTRSTQFFEVDENVGIRRTKSPTDKTGWPYS